jgi:hypothetical protein
LTFSKIDETFHHGVIYPLYGWFIYINNTYSSLGLLTTCSGQKEIHL